MLHMKLKPQHPKTEKPKATRQHMTTKQENIYLYLYNREYT